MDSHKGVENTTAVVGANTIPLECASTGPVWETNPVEETQNQNDQTGPKKSFTTKRTRKLLKRKEREQLWRKVFEANPDPMKFCKLIEKTKFDFNVNSDGKIEMEMKDDTDETDDFEGQGNIDLSQLPPHVRLMKGKNQWVYLKYKKYYEMKEKYEKQKALNLNQNDTAGKSVHQLTQASASQDSQSIGKSQEPPASHGDTAAGNSQSSGNVQQEGSQSVQNQLHTKTPSGPVVVAGKAADIRLGGKINVAPPAQAANKSSQESKVGPPAKKPPVKPQVPNLAKVMLTWKQIPVTAQQSQAERKPTKKQMKARATALEAAKIETQLKMLRQQAEQFTKQKNVQPPLMGMPVQPHIHPQAFVEVRPNVYVKAKDVWSLNIKGRAQAGPPAQPVESKVSIRPQTGPPAQPEDPKVSTPPQAASNSQPNVQVQPQALPPTLPFEAAKPRLPAGIPRSFLFKQETDPTSPYYPHHPQPAAPDTSHTSHQPQPAGDYNPDDGEGAQSSGERLSAFQRLGPVQPPPKKPRLTINLSFNKDNTTRQVIDAPGEAVEDKYTPVWERACVQSSVDDVVVKYVDAWPWRKTVPERHAPVHAQSRESALEDIQKHYEQDTTFFKVSVTGYPESWEKEDILDAILQAVDPHPFIPCFIELSRTECRFLAVRARSALRELHHALFTVRSRGVTLRLSVALTTLTLKTLDLLPRLVLRKKLSANYDGDSGLTLRAFTLDQDVSHFIYFPLRRLANQTELLQLQSAVSWEHLTELDLSHNRLISLDGFELSRCTPKLRVLDASHNCLSDALSVSLKSCRGLALKTLLLQHNPLCLRYTEPAEYQRVLRAMFPELSEIDGVAVHRAGSRPPTHRYYVPSPAAPLLGRLLDTYFPLLDLPPSERSLMAELYHPRATLTITYRYMMRYTPIYQSHRSLFLRCRSLEEGDTSDCVEGDEPIARHLCRLPVMQHDPHSFTVDCMHHDDEFTVVRVGAVVRLLADSLADEEHVLHATRTFLLCEARPDPDGEDLARFVIRNEMVYWDLPTERTAQHAFTINSVRPRLPSLKLESAPDEFLKSNLLDIFQKLTDVDRLASQKCLETKEWNLKAAIEYFVKLLKTDTLELLGQE